jgi:hypothetical protein
MGINTRAGLPGNIFRHVQVGNSLVKGGGGLVLSAPTHTEINPAFGIFFFFLTFGSDVIAQQSPLRSPPIWGSDDMNIPLLIALDLA